MVEWIAGLWRRALVRMVVPSIASVLLLCLAVFLVVLPAASRGLMGHKRQMIRELTEVVCDTLAVNYEEELAGQCTRAQAQARAINRLRHLRYGPQGKDYFWISDLHPRMILHPYRPDLEGTDLTDYTDPSGKPLFVEFARVAREKGEGYVDYTWQWKDDPHKLAPKISHVRLFEPWGWIIGTGVYIDDVQSEIASVTRKAALVSAAAVAFTVLLSSYVVWQGSRAEGERRRAEEEKRQVTEQLHQAQKVEAVGELAAGVAHDFNNLLTVVQGNADLIGKTLPPESPARSALQTIEEATRQAAGVTRSLLTFSRKLAAEKVPTDLASVVEEAARILRRMLSSSVELVINVACDAPLLVQGDATQLKQVLMNLVINARDAMPDGGTVEVSLAPACREEMVELGDFGCHDASYVRLTVRDTGAGMTPEVRSRLFEPFFTTKPRGQGTGLGLSVTHGIVSDHGGHIQVVSEPGEGSTFKVYLPRLIGVATPTERQEIRGPDAQGHGETVLLAEDHRFVREVLASALKSLGYKVVQAADGAELMEEHRRHQEDIKLLLVDVDLPKRSGLDCLEEIREQGATTPAIIMTGSVEIDCTETLPTNTWLLPKPFQVADLSGRILDALGASCCEVTST